MADNKNRRADGTINPRAKADNPKKALADMLRFVKPYWFIMIVSVVFAIGSCILMLIGPGYLAKISGELKNGFTDKVWVGVDMDMIAKIGLTLLIIYLVMFVLDYLQQWIMAKITQKISVRLRGEIIKKINRLPLAFYDETKTGDIMGRITNDVDSMSGTLNQSIITLITSSVLVAGSATAMFVTSWVLASVAVTVSLIGFVFMAIILKKSQKYWVLRADIFGDINAIAEENFGNHLAVVTNNAENNFRARFKDALDKHYVANKKGQFLSGIMQPLMGFIGNLSFVSVVVIGVLMAAKNPNMFGTIIAFMLYVRYFARPLGEIAQAGSSFQIAAASSERVFGFLREKELEDEGKITRRLDDVRGAVEFNHINFGYREDPAIIKDFSVKIKAGSSVAIVGPTGAGKTTIVNLLMKFYRLRSGDIKIDGVSTGDITRENVHNLFGMVLQDTWIFNGTLRENLCFNIPNVDDERINDAINAVGLRHFVETLPGGLDAEITENTDISGGQRQLITIARAMIKNAPLLILDEATSSVDTRTEMSVASAMEKLTAGRTSFVIAHRLSTIRNADIILVINNGDIVEQGRHDELLSRNGFYANLYRSQFAGQ